MDKELQDLERRYFAARRRAGLPDLVPAPHSLWDRLVELAKVEVWTDPDPLRLRDMRAQLLEWLNATGIPVDLVWAEVRARNEEWRREVREIRDSTRCPECHAGLGAPCQLLSNLTVHDERRSWANMYRTATWGERWKEERHERARRVPCPSCEAEAQEPCRAWWTPGPHLSRLQAWRQHRASTQRA